MKLLYVIPYVNTVNIYLYLVALLLNCAFTFHLIDFQCKCINKPGVNSLSIRLKSYWTWNVTLGQCLCTVCLCPFVCVLCKQKYKTKRCGGCFEATQWVTAKPNTNTFKFIRIKMNYMCLNYFNLLTFYQTKRTHALYWLFKECNEGQTESLINVDLC